MSTLLSIPLNISDMAEKDLTIVVCTYNRSWSLERLIEGFKMCESPVNLTWELLFIDNNSSDNTRDLLCSLRSDIPFIRYIFEGKQGLSHARNRGVDEARGKYVFFMDDDASPSRQFLVGIEGALAKHPGISCFGVKVISHFPEKPKWFAVDGPFALKGILGIYDLGENDKALTENDPLPIGSGILIDRKFLIDKGKFNTKLGVRGGVKYAPRGEDTELMERIMESGHLIFYLPGPMVNHYPDLSRYNFAYLKRMFVGSGVGMARQMEINTVKIFGIPRHLLRRLVENLLLSGTFYIRGKGDAYAYYKTRYWISLGTIMGLLRDNIK